MKSTVRVFVLINKGKQKGQIKKMEEEIKVSGEEARDKRLCEVENTGKRKREEGACFQERQSHMTFKYYLLIKVKWISCYS